jgi:hypothetical protein
MLTAGFSTRIARTIDETWLADLASLRRLVASLLTGGLSSRRLLLGIGVQGQHFDG